MTIFSRGSGLMLVAGVLLLSGCVTPGGYGAPGGGYGQSGPGPGGYGQSGPAYPDSYGSQVQGTVDGLDLGSNRIVLIVDDPRSGRAQRLDLRYDQRTRLVYQGRESAVTGLERGDVIRVDAQQSGRELVARSIEVVRNVREGGYGGGYDNGNTYGNNNGDGNSNTYGNSDYGNGSDLRGSIAYVDARARVIRLDATGYGNGVQLTYDNRTTVEYQGRSYNPANLERGDQVRIQARQVGNNQWLAERILVERSVSR